MLVPQNKLGLLSASVLIATFLISQAVAQDVTLRLHQFLPAQANVPKLILDVWADRVESETGGRIQVERFPSMQLGGRPAELIDQVIDGVADLVWTVVGYTPGRFPRTEVFELPFMMTDARAVSRAYWKTFVAHMKETEFSDVHVLATWVHGPGVIHSSRPVRTPADFKGMKIRGASRQVNKLLETLGATAVGMPLPSVPEALSKGVIDGTTIPWEVTPGFKIPEMVGHHTEFSGRALYTLTFVFAMNKERYESLPADLRAVIDKNSGEEFSVFAAGIQANEDAPAREIALANGNSIVTVSEEDAGVWRNAAEPIYGEWVADMNSRGIDGQALLDQARQLISRYTE